MEETGCSLENVLGSSTSVSSNEKKEYAVGSFGAYFVKLIKDHDFSQAKFAAELGISKTYLFDVFNGRVKPPTPDMQDRIVELLRLTDSEKNNDLADSDLTLVTPNAKSIAVQSNFDSNDRTVDALMESRDTSYAKVLTDETQYDDYDKTEDDTDGPFTLAALAEYTGKDKGGQVFVCSAGIMMSDDLMGASSLMNQYFLSNALSCMQPEIEMISIPSKSLSAQPLVMGATAQWIVFLLLALIPFAVFAAGVVVFIRRMRL